MANYGGLQPWDNTPSSAMRAAHADRERAVDVLKAAFAEGRLSQAEYEQRIGLAYQARTYGELGRLVGDLPQGPVPMPMPMPNTVRPVPFVPPTFLPYQQPRRTNPLAVASLLSGLAGLVFQVPALPAVVLGHRARKEIRQRDEAGEGMAVVGMVLGWVVVAFWSLVIVLAIVAAAAGSH